MATADGNYSRSELAQQSLQVGGFAANERRRAWLRLLDLHHLETQLVASTLQTLQSSQFSQQLAQSPRISPSSSEEHAVPLDGEDWQIPHLSQLDCVQDDLEDANQDWDGQEWSVASSKRQRRRKKAANLSNTSPSATEMTRSTTTTTIATSSPDQSRSISMEDLAGSMIKVEGSRLALKEERKKRKKEKKKAWQQGGQSSDANANGAMEASGILMPSSEVLKDEDWVEAESSKEHRDESQVALDINRSFIGGWKGEEQKLRREQLKRVIVAVLRRYDSLNYYQGYHDIISVLLLVFVPVADGNVDLGKALDAVVEVASRVSLHLLRDNMTVNMEPSMGHLKVMRNLLRRADYEVSVEVETASSLPYFALPWLISLFAHELDPNLSIAVFDYILARGPSSVIYLAVALILHSKTDSSKEDAAEKHHSLSQLPTSINVESLPLILQRADVLSEEYPLDLKTIMGPRSMLITWNQLPITSLTNSSEVATPWSHADALAEAILSGGTEQIVINSLPTPPASEDGFDESYYDRKKHKKARHNVPSPLLTFVGAVGAVGVAALLMYGAGKSGLSL